MDHVLEGIETHYEILMYWFIEEHKEENYKKLSENSYYDELKALIGAMNVIRKFLGWEPLRLSEEVRVRLEDGVY